MYHTHKNIVSLFIDPQIIFNLFINFKLKTNSFCKFNTYPEHVGLYLAFDDKNTNFSIEATISSRKKLNCRWSRYVLPLLLQVLWNMKFSNSYIHIDYKKHTNNLLDAIFSQVVKNLFAAFRYFYNRIKNFFFEKYIKLFATENLFPAPQ